MMKWSVSLGRIAGTEIRIHLTFFLLVGWFGLAAALGSGPMAGLESVAFILAVFCCVVLHEYGHILMARRFGIATRDITLLPIGGVAAVEHMPERPGQELLVALAGPAVNGLIALILFALLGANLDLGQSVSAVNDLEIGFATRLALANAMLALFNLIPAFPMDGGRVLRALLSLRLDRTRATRISVQIGQAMAFGLGLLGLFGNPILVFIALFIFLAGSQEAYATGLAEAARGATAMSATITGFSALNAESTISQAVDQLLSTAQREFPVTDGDGRLTGVLTREGMIRALAETGSLTPVGDVMERDVAIVGQRAPLSEAIAKLQDGRRSLIGVVDEQDRVVGVITLENLAEYLMVAQAGAAHRHRVDLSGSNAI